MKTLTIIILLLIIPLALAVTTDKATYSLTENVQISGSCNSANVPVAFQLGIGLNTVWDEQTIATDQKTVTITYHPASEGTHTLYAACENETAQTATFCVGASCQQQGQGGAAITNDTIAAPQNSGGGRRCRPSWSCTTWSFCNATLQQSRKCYDANNCQGNKVEVQNCSECRESWVCSLWSDCRNGQNYRSCVDDHFCGTTFIKPFLSKACELETAPGPAPVSYNQQIPPPSNVPVTQQPAQALSGWNKYWKEYKEFIIAIPSGLIFVILVFLLAAHFIKPGKKMAYDVNDLKEWVKKEREMGTSNEDIKQILKQHTGWKESEIEQSFSELKSSL